MRTHVRMRESAGTQTHLRDLGRNDEKPIDRRALKSHPSQPRVVWVPAHFRSCVRTSGAGMTPVEKAKAGDPDGSKTERHSGP